MKHLILKTMAAAFMVAGQIMPESTVYAKLQEYAVKNSKIIGACALLWTANWLVSSYLANLDVKPTDPDSTDVPAEPIVYDPGYNISVLGPLDPYLHSFDGCKYEKVAHYLKDKNVTNEFHRPHGITRQELEEVHSKRYLDSLTWSWNVAVRIMGSGALPLAFLPGNWLLQWRVLRPMKLAVGGTLKALDLAIEHGYAFNIGAGFHHAQSDSYPVVGGYCVFGDIQLAVKRYHTKHKPEGKVLIVDLDAHQGNGYEYDIRKGKLDKEKVACFDVYNKNDYPGYDDSNSALDWRGWVAVQPEPNRDYIKYNYPITDATTTEEYLNIVKQGLKKAIEEFGPDLIIYNAGTDILEGDPEGKLKISEQGIIDRDALVFAAAFEHNTPIFMLTSGGYTQQSAGAIGKSIENVIQLKKSCSQRKQN